MFTPSLRIESYVNPSPRIISCCKCWGGHLRIIFARWWHKSNHQIAPGKVWVRENLGFQTWANSKACGSLNRVDIQPLSLLNTGKLRCPLMYILRTILDIYSEGKKCCFRWSVNRLNAVLKSEPFLYITPWRHPMTRYFKLMEFNFIYLDKGYEVSLLVTICVCWCDNFHLFYRIKVNFF